MKHGWEPEPGTKNNTVVIHLDQPTITRIGLNLLALLGISVALYLAETIFVPLTIAVLLAAILWPMAEWLYLRRVPWSISCTIVVGLLVVLFGVVIAGFTLSVPKMLQGLPPPGDYSAQTQFYEEFRKQVIRVSPVAVDPVLPEEAERSRLFHYVRDTINSRYMTDLLLQLGGYFNRLLINFVLVMFVALFLLMEGRMLTRRIVEIFGPSPEAQDKVLVALEKMARSVRTYLVWRTIVNFGLGIVLGLVFHAVGVKHSWTWALLAAVLCYIPYIGTILAGVPPVLDAFVNVGPWAALGILIFYVAIVTFEGYVIVPVVMGRSMELNATTVMLSCLFWDLVWGTPGLFLAMPLMAALKAVCETVPGWRPFANLMGTNHGPVPVEAPPMPLVEAIDPEKTAVIGEKPAAKAGAYDGALPLEKTALLENGDAAAKTRPVPPG